MESSRSMNYWYIGAAVVIVGIVVYFMFKGNSSSHLSTGGGGGGGPITLFFSPGCGHCTQLMPTWSELEAKYGSKLTKIDCSQQKCEGVPGYPTIKAADGTKYSGDRSAADLSKFIDSH